MLKAGAARRGSRAAFSRAAFLLAAALALAGCGDSVSPLPGAGAPDTLHFSFGGFGVGQSTVELRGETVILRRSRWGNDPRVVTDSVRVVPSAEAWRAFWAGTERAGVHRWRSRYVVDDVVDGTGWSLRIVVGGRRVESTGSNAFPDRFGRRHELGMTDDFLGFVTALDELVGSPVRFWVHGP